MAREGRGFASRASRFPATRTIRGRAQDMLQPPRRLHLLVLGPRPSRPEGGRRVPFLSRADAEPLQRQHGRSMRPERRLRRISRRSCRPGRRRHVEPERAESTDHGAITIGVGDFNVDFIRTAVRGSRTTGKSATSDVEPRPTLRRDHERLCERRCVPAVPSRRAVPTTQQCPTATRLCVSVGRSDGGAGRHGHLLRRCHFPRRELDGRQHPDRDDPDSNDGRPDFATNPFNGRPLPTL